MAGRAGGQTSQGAKSGRSMSSNLATSKRNQGGRAVADYDPNLTEKERDEKNQLLTN